MLIVSQIISLGKKDLTKPRIWLMYTNEITQSATCKANNLGRLAYFIRMHAPSHIEIWTIDGEAIHRPWIYDNTAAK